MSTEDEILTVAEVCAMFDKRPQEINAYVRKGQLQTRGENPRRVSLADVVALFNAPKPKRERKVKEEGEEKVNPTHARFVLNEAQKKLFMWSRGDGKGLALFKPTERCQPLDDFLELLSSQGRTMVATGTKLRDLFNDGQLFFMEPTDVLVFVLQQLSPYAPKELTEDLRDVTERLQEWRKTYGRE